MNEKKHWTNYLIDLQKDVGNVMSTASLQLLSALTNTLSFWGFIVTQDLPRYVPSISTVILLIVLFAAEFTVKGTIREGIAGGSGHMKSVAKALFITVGIGLLFTALGLSSNMYDPALAYIIAFGTSVTSIGSLFQMEQVGVREGKAIIAKEAEEARVLKLKADRESLAKAREDLILANEKEELLARKTERLLKEKRERAEIEVVKSKIVPPISSNNGKDTGVNEQNIQPNPKMKSRMDILSKLNGKFTFDDVSAALKLSRSTTYPIIQYAKNNGVIKQLEPKLYVSLGDS